MLHWIPLTFSKACIDHMLFCQSTVKRLTVRYMPQYKIQTTCLPITFTDNVLYLSLKLRSHRMRRRRRRAAYGIFAATWRKRCDTKHSDKFHYLIMFVSLTNKGKRNSLLQPVLVVKLCCKLECGPMPNLMAALPNIGGALYSTPQSVADAHY